jgi:DNA-binding beta-propeller fold protein YncE
MKRKERVKRGSITASASAMMAAPFALIVTALLLLPTGSAGAVHPHGGPIAAQCGVGSYPSFPAYDPANHLIYVPNQVSGNISVIQSPCKVIATISLPHGADPVQAAFSPANDAIYVADTSLQQVYVIEKNKVVATINGGHFNTPTAIAWDPGDSVMLVANFGWANVTAIDNRSYAGTIATGSQPDAISYDPYFDTILVDCFGSSNITILPSAVFPFATAHSNTSYGGGGEMMAFDPANNYDYTASYSLASVTVINGLGYYGGSIAVGKAPLDLAFDQSTLHMFVTNEASHSVYALSGTSVVKKFVIAKGLEPFGLAYSDYALNMYATVINASTQHGEVIELS